MRCFIQISEAPVQVMWVWRSITDHLTCQAVLCVQQFVVDLPLQLVGFVCILGRSSLPVHSALAQPASVKTVGAHPQEHASLQCGWGTWGAFIAPPRGREAVHWQGHHLRTSGLRVVLLIWGTWREMAAFWTGDGHLPHQTVPVKHGHVQAEIWRKKTHRRRCFLVLWWEEMQFYFLKIVLLNIFNMTSLGFFSPTWECLCRSYAGIQGKRRWLAVSRTVRVDGGSELVSCTQRSRWGTPTHARLKPPLLSMCEGPYRSPWWESARAGCGAGRGTGWRTSPAGRRSPDNNPSNRILAWAWTVTSASHHTNSEHGVQEKLTSLFLNQWKICKS